MAASRGFCQPGQAQGHDRGHRVPGPGDVEDLPGLGGEVNLRAWSGEQQHAVGTQGDEEMIEGQVLPEPGPGLDQIFPAGQRLPTASSISLRLGVITVAPA